MKKIFEKLVVFFRLRLWIHIAGAVLASEVTLSINSLWLSGKNLIFYSAITALVIGILSELKDILFEVDYPHKGWKHFVDIMSWVFGGLIFIGLELLQ
jgi:hypothetical protein